MQMGNSFLWEESRDNCTRCFSGSILNDLPNLVLREYSRSRFVYLFFLRLEKLDAFPIMDLPSVQCALSGSKQYGRRWLSLNIREDGIWDKFSTRLEG